MNNKKSARDQKLNNSNPHTSWGNVGVENEWVTRFLPPSSTTTGALKQST